MNGILTQLKRNSKVLRKVCAKEVNLKSSRIKPSRAFDNHFWASKLAIRGWGGYFWGTFILIINTLFNTAISKRFIFRSVLLNCCTTSSFTWHCSKWFIHKAKIYYLNPMQSDVSFNLLSWLQTEYLFTLLVLFYLSYCHGWNNYKNQ